MIRVIAGELGGRRLHTPSGMRTRPTAERVREALFNILGPPPAGAMVLDLYAGSGALGIEALSRGAARAVFVEQDAGALQTLKKNLRTLSLEKRAILLPRPVRSALPLLLAHAPFQWVFADPPYKSEELPFLLDRFATAALLAPHGLFIVERAARDADSLAESLLSPSCLKLCDRRQYGDTALLFYRSAGEAS